MKKFSCSDAGASCTAQVTATDEQDLVRQLTQHVRQVHKIEPNETILTYLVSKAYDVGGGSR
ncbi:DUF1059 domain-containing protein [Carbonactinospora thermoautotrophica]|uniref:DUF1059 domain-containing protein n=1 Tax=Carbonactinospora thermoautotrophica TaxID=1469144 RepID=A0A132ND17_9ACTN|nr:DUF1059 domain-containing protein [Carbonactinospora thermoautotrophica]KWX05477.1 hypothetical protein TH66_01950 [Carbonactinospora thermoautotrophica]KWX08041.1 hypothetical protein TR74_16670 [Carbonactinospora thermoautotrophica]MCX9192434.1 DUF1059 domain-containing protein [Carbonactinospora thermoautotrophica]